MSPFIIMAPPPAPRKRRVASAPWGAAPNCRVATATAARAASGSVRSPAAAWAVIPWAASSRTRSPSISALRLARTSFAPARPSPWATAWPI